MDVTRAQQIIVSEQRIHVEMEGTPVWIEGVDPQSGTARVYPEGNPADKRTVSVNQLKEVH